MSRTSADFYSASRLSAYCTGVIEACWLAAIGVIPLLYNPHSLNGFDSAKINLLRLLAAVTLAAWLIGIVDQPVFRTQTLASVTRLWRSRLVIPVGSLLFSYLLANFCSIYPSVSFWGTYDYFQGTFTFLCLLVLFGAVATFLRRADQVERFVLTILASSFPIAIYAIVQQARLDPQSFPDITKMEGRSFSLLGHANYLGAYLGFVLPLTIFRLIEIIRTRRDQDPETTRLLSLRIGVYLVVVAAQAGALLCTKSRSGLLGAGTTLFFFGLFLAAHKGRRRLGLAITVLAFVAASFILVLNFPDGPLKALRAVPGFDRLSQMLPLGRGLEESSDMRSTVWELAPRIMFPQGSGLIAGRGPDPVFMFRPVVGYGPETLAAVMRHYLLQPGFSWDRFHNLMLDTWFAVGIAGVIGTLWLFANLFFIGLRKLRIVRSRGDQRMFVFLVCSCTIVCAATPVLFGAPGFAGLGLQLGLVIAASIFLLLKTRRSNVPVGHNNGRWDPTGVVIAILAALAGHIVESSFSFVVAATLAFFWIYGGVLVAVVEPRFDVGNLEQRWQRAPGGITTVGTSAFVPALSLVVILFSFIYLYSDHNLGIPDVLTGCFLKLRLSGKPSYMLVWLIPAAWLVPCFIAAESTGERTGSGWWQRFVWSAAVTGLVGGFYALVKMYQISKIGALPSRLTTWEQAQSQAASDALLIVVFVIAFLLLLLLGGFFLAQDQVRNVATKPFSLVWAGMVTVLLTIFCIQGLKRARADSYLHWGGILQVTGSERLGLGIRRLAMTLEPGVSLYRILLARSSISLAEGLSEDRQFEQLMSEAESVLLPTRSWYALSSADADLGDLYLRWAAREQASERRRELTEKASNALARAVQDEPGFELGWVEAAIADQYLGQESDALAKERMANGVTASRYAEGWADFYYNIAPLTTSVDLRKRFAERGAEIYDRLTNSSRLPAAQFDYRCRQTTLFILAADSEKAIAASKQALTLAPQGRAWEAEKALAESYLALGDIVAALNAIDLAISHAPTSSKPQLLQLRSNIQSK